MHSTKPTTVVKDKLANRSLRKLPLGLASIALGASIYMNTTNVSADQVDNTDTYPLQSQDDTNAVLPGTPVNTSKVATTNETQEAQAPVSENNVSQPATDNVSSNTNSQASAFESNSDVNSSASVTTDNSNVTSDNKTVNDSTKDNDVTITYNVSDVDENNKNVFTGKYSLPANSHFSFADFQLPENYILAENGDGTVGTSNTSIEVKAKHKTIQLESPKPVLIERTITINFPDNSVKTIRQQGYYQSPTSVLDEVTKTSKTIGKASLTGIDTYWAPTIAGYTANIPMVPALTEQEYDKGAKLSVNISYSKNGSNSSASSDAPDTPEINTPGSNSDNTNSSSSAASSAPISNQEAAKGNENVNNATSASSSIGETTTNSSSVGVLANDDINSVANTTALTGNETTALTGNETTSTEDSTSPESNNDTITSNDELPQTGNDSISKDLALLGIGALGITGAVGLEMRKKKY